MTDEIFKSDFHYQNHTDTVTHKLTQPTEDLILNRNAELRKNKGVLKDLGSNSGTPWGRQLASIPMIMYEKACKDGYDLKSTNKEVAASEMHRFLATPEGKACLV